VPAAGASAFAECGSTTFGYSSYASGSRHGATSVRGGLENAERSAAAGGGGGGDACILLDANAAVLNEPGPTESDGSNEDGVTGGSGLGAAGVDAARSDGPDRDAAPSALPSRPPSCPSPLTAASVAHGTDGGDAPAPPSTFGTGSRRGPQSGSAVVGAPEVHSGAGGGLSRPARALEKEPPPAAAPPARLPVVAGTSIGAASRAALSASAACAPRAGAAELLA
jgi:hypothetical protein